MVENTQGTRPEGIDPKLWDLLRRSLDGLAFRVPIAPAAISASGLVESMDQLDSSLTNERLDTWVSDLSITGAATALVPILQFSGATGWSAEPLRSAQVSVSGPWVNLGSDENPVLVRRTDGLLGTRAPLVIQQASGNKIQVTRFDGSKTEVTLPLQRNRSDSRRFRFAYNKTVDYFDGNAWKPFRRADYPFSILDTPAKKTGSLAHLEEAGTWVIDANDDLWFQKLGTSNRKSIVLPEGAKAIALVWRSAGQGARVLTVKTDTGIFQVDQERVGDRFIEVAKPEEAPVIRAGLEWRDGFSTPFFDGNPVWLRGLAFDHEIPTGIAVDAGSIRADVQINGSPRQRRLDPRTGELTGRLLEPKKTAPRQPQVIRTPAGRLDLDRRTGKATLRTPSLVGDEVLESEWSPSNGALEVDRVHRLLPVRDGGWIQLTPKGLILGVTSNFSESTVLSPTDGPRAVDLRPSVNRGVYVKRDDGSVLKIDSIAATPRVVPLNQTAFSEDAIHSQVPARRVADRAFAKLHGQQMPIPSPLYWDAGQGAFSFELVNPELVDSMATSSQGQVLRASTMSGPLWLDHQGRMRLQDSNKKPMAANPVASTAADTIQLRRSDFSRGQSRPSLSFLLAGDPEERLDVPWKLEDGLLPHRTFTAVAPLGPNAAGGFSRLGVHRFPEDRFTPPVILFDDLRRKPTIYLSDGLNASQARFEDGRDSIELTEAGVIQRLSDNSPPNSASRIDVVPGHPKARIRRKINDGRRSFEIFIEDGPARVQLPLTKAGFLMDQTRASVFDAGGRLVISGDGEKLLRIEDRSSCLDASIIRQNLADMNLELGFSAPTVEAVFLTDADQNSLRIFKDQAIPFPTGMDATAHLQRLQPLDDDGTPKPKQFFVGEENSSQKRRIFEWRQGEGKPNRDLVERNGFFDHDRITSVARVESNRTDQTDLIAKGANSLSWRDEETGSLVDVIHVRAGLDDTPLVSNQTGEWNVRSEEGWHLLLLDDQNSAIRMEAAGDRSLRLGFDTPDWIWEWTDRPQIMDRASGRIWSPVKTSWLRGDEIKAFIGEGPDRLYTTNTGIRISSEEPGAMRPKPLTSPNPKPVRTDLGTMFISEDEKSLISFSDGMINLFPREDAVIEASGDQLQVSISLDSMPSLAWHPPSNDPTDTAINLPFPFTSLEGDHVLACGMLGDRLMALTPLGCFDTQNPTAPANGPPLGRDDRKLVYPGLAWLESDSGPQVKVVLSDGPGGYLVEENDDSTHFELSNDFTSADSTIILLDDSRWGLVRRFEAGTWTKKFVDQDRGLEMNTKLGIRSGQLRFDQVLGLGIDEDGAWICTELAEERIDESGRLMPVHLRDPGTPTPASDPSAASYTRQIAGTPGTRIRLPEFELVIENQSLGVADGTPVVTKHDGSRIFQLPSGILIVDENGAIQWIRNQSKWFEQSRSDRKGFESSE
ncbi:hypothetical protein OAG62_00540 [bacterium]|nr:hypothetical protein [bacterium]